MSKTLTLPIRAMAQLVSGTTYDKTAQSYKTGPWYTDAVYIQFDPLPAALANVSPSSIELHFYVIAGGEYTGIDTWSLDGTLDIENDVFPTSPGPLIKTGYITSSGWNSWTLNSGWIDTRGRDWITNGVALLRTHYSAGTFYSPTSPYQPYAVLTYNEGSLVAYADAPGGYIDRTAANTFSWHTTWVGFPAENATQSSAKLQWKNGASGTVNTINISGSSTSYTMAANTLPASSELYWRVQTVSSGTTVTSDWKAITTTDTAAVTTGLSPDGAYIDGSKTARFSWSYQTDSGTAQKAYDLQVKAPTDADFSTIKSETTANTYADISAGTLPGGAIQWRVRGYNQSSIAGDWSEPLQAVVIAAPAAPEIWVSEATCRPTVEWTAVGQLAYQVRLEAPANTYDTGTVFGTSKSYKFPDYIFQDVYQFSVRVLGEYDLWSPWSRTYAACLNGKSGESITLTAQAVDGDAVLAWTAAADATGYEILRQGKKIGETTALTWTDPYAIGDVSYRVRAVFAGSDDYVLSNAASVTLRVPAPRITAPGGVWIDLGLSTEPLPMMTAVSARDVTFLHFAGEALPHAEIAPQRTRTYTCAPAFRTAAEASVFAALLGKIVFLKDQYGTSMTGVMASVQLRHGDMYTVAAATIQEIGGVKL